MLLRVPLLVLVVLLFGACEQLGNFKIQTSSSGHTSFQWDSSAWSNSDCQNFKRPQSRTSSCKNDGDTLVSESLCKEAKPANYQLVEDPTCFTYRWNSSAWSNSTCRSGNRLQTRSNSCRNDLNAEVADSFCSVDKPTDSQILEDTACLNAFEWVTTPWSDMTCTATTGTRLQLRQVTCTNGYGATVDDLKCAPTAKPPTSQPISDTTCVSATERTLLINAQDNRAAVHVFFIIDNSNSMSDEQPRVLAAVRTFVNKVEAQSGLKARYTVLSSTAREAVGFNSNWWGVASGNDPGWGSGSKTLNPMLPFGLGQEGILISYPQWNKLTQKYIPETGKDWQVRATTLEESHAVSDFRLNYIWQQAPGSSEKTYSLDWNPRTEAAPIHSGGTYSPNYSAKYNSLFGFSQSKTNTTAYPVITPPDIRTTNLLGAKFGFEASWKILAQPTFEKASEQSIQSLSQAITDKIVSLGTNGSTDSMGRCVVAQALVGNFLKPNERPLFVVISDAEDKTRASGPQVSYWVDHDCFSKLSISQEFKEFESKYSDNESYLVYNYGPQILISYDLSYYPVIPGTIEDERATVSTTLTSLTDRAWSVAWQPSSDGGYPGALPPLDTACSAATRAGIISWNTSVLPITLPGQNLSITHCRVTGFRSGTAKSTSYNSTTGSAVDCARAGSDALSLIARSRGTLYQRAEDKALDTCSTSPGYYHSSFGHMWATTAEKRLLQHELLGLPTSQYPGDLDTALQTHLLEKFGPNGFGITAIYNRPAVSFCSSTGNTGKAYEDFINKFSSEAKAWDICAGSYEGALVDLANFATGNLSNTFILANLQATENIVSVTILYASGAPKVLVLNTDYTFTRAGASIKLINGNVLLAGDKLEVRLKSN